MKKSSFAYALVFALVLFATSCQSPSPQPAQPVSVATPAAITPTDIPSGYGYPGDRAQVQAWADAWEIAKITQHTWDLWAGMTADSGQTFNGSKLPYWETWCGTEEVFGGICGKAVRPGHPFRLAAQLTHVARLKGLSGPPDTQVISFNKFNPSMAQYVQARHAGPGTAGPYNYASVTSLIALNNAWPSNTATVDRKVEETPYQPTTPGATGYAAIETKPVIFLVKAAGLTPMPLWLGPAGSTNQNNPTPNTWTTCVLLDPAADRKQGLNAVRLHHVPIRAAGDNLQFQNGCRRGAVVEQCSRQWRHRERRRLRRARRHAREQQGDYQLDLADLLVATGAGCSEQFPW